MLASSIIYLESCIPVKLTPLEAHMHRLNICAACYMYMWHAKCVIIVCTGGSVVSHMYAHTLAV